MLTDFDLLTASSAQLLECVVDMEPGLFAQSVLLMIDRSTLSPSDAVTCLQVHERISAWWASVQAEFLVAAASGDRQVEEFTLLDPRPGHDQERTVRVEDAVREEIAAALRWSPVTAQHRIDTARLLAGPLAATHEAMSLGEISTGHVAVLVEASSRLPGRYADGGQHGADFTIACAQLQSRVLPVARCGTLSATRAAARRAVLAIDADGARRRRLAARCTRDVYVVDDLDGISTLIARMATEDAHALMTAIDTRAAADESTTPIGEKRATALRELVLDSATDLIPGSGHHGNARRSAHLDLVIDLATVLDLTDNPAQLTGSGRVLPDVVRDLLADPDIAVTMRRLVTDPLTGHLLDIGRRSYAVPDRLREYVQARDVTCRFPGCRRRATTCQIDHAHPWDDNGQTSRDNLGALCVRHHQLKTHAGWAITESQADGTCTWTSPHGRHYDHPPEQIA